MKAIRRSLKTDRERDRSSPSKHQPSASLNLYQKSHIAIVPPKKVVKALYDYEPNNKNDEELAFHRGDFLYVISREDDSEWYEACNPLIPTARGLVPVAFFEVVEKQQRQSTQSARTYENTAHDSGFAEGFIHAHSPEVPNLPEQTPIPTQRAPGSSMHSRGLSTAKAGAMVYGIVLYDFQAERPDELDAKSGEAIIVVAQSNPEWFVAKPIGRLGGPGLIPVSYIQLRDTTTNEPVTDPLAAVRAAGVPRVEEWKRTAAEYKNSSISLGQINTPQIGGVQHVTQGMDRISLQNQQRQQVQAQPQMQQIRTQQQPPPQQQQQTTTLLAPLSASVPRYCFDNDMYWYIIEAQMSDGRWWELARYYADFYDFQIALLEKFPAEAGQTGKPRTLPYMPGPVAHVTDAISNGRRQNLDEYIKKIVDQPAYIREDALVRQLFAPRSGQDYEIDPTVDDDYRLSGHSLAQTQSRTSSGAGSMQMPAPPPHGSMPPPPNPSTMRSYYNDNSHLSYASANSAGGVGKPSYAQPALHSQNSNLTQHSTGSNNSGALPPPSTSGALRLKIQFESDTVAIRVEEGIKYPEFEERIFNRLKIAPGKKIKIAYFSDTAGTLVPLNDEDDLKNAKEQRNFRVNVEYAKPQ